jgi:hypothetical protein
MLKTRSVSLLTCQLRVNGRGDVLPIPTGLGSFALRLFFPALVVCNLLLMSSVPVSAVPTSNTKQADLSSATVSKQWELEGKLIRPGAHGIQRPQLRAYFTVPIRGPHLASVSNAEQRCAEE